MVYASGFAVTVAATGYTIAGWETRQRLTIGAHELVATDESGECNRFAAGLAEIVPDLAVSIAV